jgi:hypothetical protein
VVTARIIDGCLEIDLRGMHKVWALKRTIHISLASIQGAEIAAERAREGPAGIKNPGTSIPHVLSAGTFTAGVHRAFWDVHNPDKAIRIKLKSDRSLFSGLDDRYDELIVEVENPVKTVALINQVVEEGVPGHIERQGSAASA